jgi:hypothetical protein
MAICWEGRISGMGKVEDYRHQLIAMDAWDDFLKKESRLPGPRANLELAYAVAWEGTLERLLGYASLDEAQAPENTPECFLAICGVLGIGVLAARGEGEYFDLLRAKSTDPRWRIREATALGLQIFGRKSMDRLLVEMKAWSHGTFLEKRAVVATLCEPDLLLHHAHALKVFDILDRITASIIKSEDRKNEGFKVLRKGLAYGWSVAAAAQPDPGKVRMEHWIGSPDRDMRWIMKQNLKKKRLMRMDEGWVNSQLKRLES